MRPQGPSIALKGGRAMPGEFYERDSTKTSGMLLIVFNNSACRVNGEMVGWLQILHKDSQINILLNVTVNQSAGTGFWGWGAALGEDPGPSFPNRTRVLNSSAPARSVFASSLSCRRPPLRALDRAST